MDVVLFADPEKRGWRRHAVLHTCWACLLCTDFYLQGTRLVVFFSASRWPLSCRLVFFTYRGRTFPIKSVLTEFVKQHTIWWREVFSCHAPSPHADLGPSQKTAKRQQINFQDWFETVSKQKNLDFLQLQFPILEIFSQTNCGKTSPEISPEVINYKVLNPGETDERSR